MRLTPTALLPPIFNKSLLHAAVRSLHNDLFNGRILLAHVNGIHFRRKGREFSAYYFVVISRVRCGIEILQEIFEI